MVSATFLFSLSVVLVYTLAAEHGHGSGSSSAQKSEQEVRSPCAESQLLVSMRRPRGGKGNHGAYGGNGSENGSKGMYVGMGEDKSEESVRESKETEGTTMGGKRGGNSSGGAVHKKPRFFCVSVTDMVESVGEEIKCPEGYQAEKKFCVKQGDGGCDDLAQSEEKGDKRQFREMCTTKPTNCKRPMGSMCFPRCESGYTRYRHQPASCIKGTRSEATCADGERMTRKGLCVMKSND